jgi:hypothetical protein
MALPFRWEFARYPSVRAEEWYPVGEIVGAHRPGGTGCARLPGRRVAVGNRAHGGAPLRRVGRGDTVVERARRTAAIDLLLDETLLVDGDRVADYLVAFATGLVRAFLDPDFAALRRMVIAEVVHHPALSQVCREGTPNRVKALLGDRLERFATEGVLDVDVPDARRAADQFVGLLVYDLQRESAWGTVPVSEEQIAGIATVATEFFLRAYGPTTAKQIP